MAQFAAMDGGRSARQGGPSAVLDLHLYQLAAHTILHPRLGEKYKDHGLVVIGVHTPEFEFERNEDNVRRAAKDMRVEYPIAIDSRRPSATFSTRIASPISPWDPHHQSATANYMLEEIIHRDCCSRPKSTGDEIIVDASGDEYCCLLDTCH